MPVWMGGARFGEVTGFPAEFGQRSTCFCGSPMEIVSKSHPYATLGHPQKFSPELQLLKATFCALTAKITVVEI